MNFIPKAAAGPPGRTVRTDEITVNDVLCGRGGDINVHVGNERYRKMIESRKMDYLTATYKRDKRIIASSIVNEIHALVPPGRFMSKIQAPGRKRSRSKCPDLGWFEIGEEKAIEKASQALRENAPSIRKQIGQESQQGVEKMPTGDEKIDDVIDETFAVIKSDCSVPSATEYPSKFPSGSLQRLPCGALQQVPSGSAHQILPASQGAPSVEAPSSPFESFLAEMLVDNTKPSAADFDERKRPHQLSQQQYSCEGSSQLWPSTSSSNDRATISMMPDCTQWFPSSPCGSHRVTASFSFESSFPEVSCSSSYNLQDTSFHRPMPFPMQQHSHAASANGYHLPHEAMAAAKAANPGAGSSYTGGISSYDDRSQQKRMKLSSSQHSSFPLSPIRYLREALPYYPPQYVHQNYSYFHNAGDSSFGQQQQHSSAEQYAPFHLSSDPFSSHQRPTAVMSNSRPPAMHQQFAGNISQSFDFSLPPSSQQLRSVSNSAEHGEDYDSFHSLL